MENLAPAFTDGKEPGALRTIGEVAKALGLKQHVLRYWEEQFPTLKPLTRAGGRRYYRPGDIALLSEIDRLLHQEGYTIRGARAALAERGAERDKVPGAVVALAKSESDSALEPVAAMPAEEEIIAAIRILRRHLETIRDRLAGALEE